MQSSSRDNSRDNRSRYFAIDYIKATAIVAVVLTHAGPPAANYDAGWFDVFFRGSLVQFHVPSFLAVSGFLYANAAVMDATTCRRRLVRILVPYLVASLLVFVLLVPPPSMSYAIFMLATGSALFPYYFVFVLATCTLAVFLLTQISPRAPEMALLVLVAAGLARVMWMAPPPGEVASFWAWRDPAYLGTYFFAGWVVRRQWSHVRRLLCAHRAAFVITGVVATAIHFASFPILGSYGLILTRAGYVAAVIPVFAILTHRREPGPITLFLSDSSYTIYLYHKFFMIPLMPYAISWEPAPRTIVLTAVGLAGSALVVILAQRIVGNRARLLFGTPVLPEVLAEKVEARTQTRGSPQMRRTKTSPHFSAVARTSS